MPITNPTPVTVPAEGEKTFPHLWISRLIIAAPSAEKGVIRVVVKPYNDDTKEILDEEQQISCNDLWKAAAEVPEVAQAMGAVFQAMPALQAWLNPPAPPVEEVEGPHPDPEDVPESPDPA